jgi:hypothetical protein
MTVELDALERRRDGIARFVAAVETCGDVAVSEREDLAFLEAMIIIARAVAREAA